MINELLLSNCNKFFIKKGAKIVKSSHFELDYMLGRKITFFCMARGFPRPEITWYKDDIELYHHKFFQVREIISFGNNLFIVIMFEYIVNYFF